jgi:gliding motility-associated-like protein
MKKIIKLLLLTFVCFNTFKSYAQISAPLANSSVSTAYTNGATNDLIYIFCSSPSVPNTGTLIASPLSGTAPFTFSWYSYNTGTNNWQTYTTTNGATSTISGLASGGYFVTITDAGGSPSGCYRAWVFVNQTIVDAGAPINGCSPFSLSGNANAVANFVYYNPPANPLIISNTTQIQVCFNATHTWVSDLGFYLVGPPICGSPTVLLSPNPGSIGQGTICNSGNNVVNLCFSTSSTNTLNVCSPAPATLSGTYGRYGPGAGTAINWSPLYGCDANSGGWTVQIYDCIGGDVGTLTNATLSIVGASTCGSINVNYNSGAISSSIADNSCNAGTASSFTVPPIIVNTPITLSNSITSAAWSTGATTLITSVNPAPTVNTWYYLTATDNFGCSHMDSVLFTNTCVCTISSVTANSSAINCSSQTFSISGQVTFTDPPLSGTLTVQNCSGDQVTFNAPFSSPISYSIPNINADGTSSCQVTAVFSADAACTAASSVFIEPNMPSTPIAGSNSPICEGTSINLTASNVSGATYSWTGPNGFNVSTQNPTIPIATPSMTGVYNVTVTLGGCVSSAGTTNVLVNAIPATPAVSSNSPVCEGSIINLTASTVNGATYSWTGPNSFTSTTQNPSIANATTSMSGVYSVIATENACNSIAGTTTVTVNSIPSTPIAGSNSPICEGNSINLTANTLVGATYSWTGPNGYSNTLQNPILSNATSLISGVYSVTITLNGCTSLVGTTNVTVNPIPSTPNPGSNSPVCEGSSINLTTPTIAVATYSWTGPNGFISTSQNPSISNSTSLMSGVYSVTVTLGGCSSLAGTTSVIVNPSPSTPTAGSNSPICVGSIINLTSSSLSGATYSWSGPNGFTSTSQNPNLTNATSSMTGVYNLTITLNGCASAVGSTNVVVNPLPIVPTPSVVNASCTNANGSVSIGGNFTSYALTGIAPTVPVVSNSTGIFNTITPGIYTIVVTNSSGCVSAPVNITILNTDNLDCDGDGVINSTEVNNGTDPNNPCSYLITSVTLPQQGIWLTVDCDGDGVTNEDEVSDGTDPIDHCSFVETSITLPVTVVCIGDLIVIIPNVFTPNGDGFNDVFFLNITNGISIKAFIFNRWGKTIYEWSELSGSWNGTISGEREASEGTYYYVFEIEDKNGDIQLFKGHLILNR